MHMRKTIIYLISALCLFTASVAEGLCCADDMGDCGATHEMHSKQSNEHDKDMGSHSCCHAHNIAIKAEKLVVAEIISVPANYTISDKQLITQHEASVLLEPPARA